MLLTNLFNFTIEYLYYINYLMFKLNFKYE